MTSRLLRGVLLALLAGAAAVAQSPTSRPAIAPNTRYEDYRILTDRNIFLKDRSRPTRGSGSRPTYTRPAPSDESYMVVTGVASSGDEWVAFVEDTRTGATTRAAVGEQLGGGRVAAVGLDGIEYQSGIVRRSVAIGENIAGASAVPTSPTTQPTASAPAGPTSQPTTAGGSEDVREQMRRRRAEQVR